MRRGRRLATIRIWPFDRGSTHLQEKSQEALQQLDLPKVNCREARHPDERLDASVCGAENCWSTYASLNERVRSKNSQCVEAIAMFCDSQRISNE